MTNTTINRLDAAAKRWLEDNPQVLDLYERFALELLEKGKPFGMMLLTQRVRWEVHMNWNPDEDGFKVNNNHTPYISRILIAKHPALANLVRTRRVLGEDD